MLSVVLHAVLKAVYGAEVAVRDLRRAFAEMTAWESFLYSDSRTVYRGAKKAEALLGRGALLTGHMKVARPDWDVLNLAHQPWHSLWKPQEIRTDSVPELFGLARIRAAALAGLSCGMWSSFDELSALRRSDRIFTPQRVQAECDDAYRMWKRAVQRAGDWIEH